MTNAWIPPISIVEGMLAAGLAYLIFASLYQRKNKRRRISGTKHFIFHDNFGYRWSFLKRFGILLGIVSLIVLCIFGLSLNSDPSLPKLSFEKNSKLNLIQPIMEKINEHSLIKQLKEEEKTHPTFQLDFKRHHKNKAMQQMTQKEVYGFYVNWDENSKNSLKKNIHFLTTVIPEWYHLNPDTSLHKDIQSDVQQLAKNNNVKIMPLVSNFANGIWDATLVHNIITSPAKRQEFIEQLYSEAKKNDYSGFNIDFEAIDKKDQDALTAFMGELYRKFHANGLQLTEDVPAQDDAFDYGALANVTDRMIVMLYDEHYQSGKPGPIASISWFENALEQLDIPPEKLIVSLGSYGYDWIENSNQSADTVTFGDIMEMAHNSRLNIQWDKRSQNPYMRYKEGEDNHIVWFLDGASVYNQLKISMENGARGVALWRLGSEDPTVWDVLKQPDHFESQTALLHTLTSSEPVHYSGDGEVLQVVSSEKEGKRDFNVTQDGSLSNESYVSYPVPFQVNRYGKAMGKQVVLTFDDGPDPEYTPKILDILDRYKIKGSFFIVGENAELNPDIIKRIYQNGHEIGSHTFTHPNVAEISPMRTKMELNANQRLFQEITGHSMTMFRPPYVADASPSTPEELLPILRAQQMGYTTIGESIDPEDWQKPSSDEIIRRVLKELPNGNIILLHDAGGDRTNTIEALPKIIETLKSKGYTFTTIHQLLGKKADELMPPVEYTENPFIIYDQTVFTAFSGWQKGITFMLYLSISVGIIRFLFLVYYASRQKKRYLSLTPNNSFTPSVSVVIAAYNEEKVICKTIDSILQSDYPDFEVIVVDDGSVDQTSAVIQKTFGQNSRIKLITKENGGKSSAVNRGFIEASGEIVVALDADTMIAPDAIALLTRHFADPNIAAVSGNVKVGNIRNLLTTWQQVEYITGFNLERRAFDELNCIAVVPGAIGAWRKEAVAEAGYLKEDTLAEDTDITLTLLQKGYRIMYEEQAYAYTEAPEDVLSLLKQRYRWTYGTLQCLWKHRRALFNRKHKSLGFVGLPNMWLFQYIFQTISPIADILFIMGLFGIQPGKTLVFYGLFFLIDFLASFYAFRLEGENPKPLLWLFLQRIIYRQFMTYIVIKSLVSALKGITVGWNKLQRLGNVINK